MRDYGCIICGTPEPVYLFRVQDAAIVTCPGCNLVSKEPPALFQNETTGANQRLEKARAFIAAYIDKLLSTFELRSILLVSPTEEPDLKKRLAHKFLLTQKNESELFSMQERSKFDCVALCAVLDTSINPDLLLQQAHSLLRPEGQLLISNTRINKQAAYEHLNHQRNWQETNFSFSRSTLQMLLEKNHFHKIILSCDGQSSAFRPIVSAQKAEKSTTRTLSVIMPVYNEKNTFAKAFSLVANKHTHGVDETEIIIVESNSTDGSREAVQAVAAASPNIKVVFEDKASGKGHAVREGLKHATGEIVLIQDADLEYDINDYDALVKPLLEYKRPFVLGTRHSGNWKIRHFADQRFFALICNVGHIFFTSIINILYSQSLSDPFTMFKVFRRECIYGLKFECNRFDFDHELVIKLIRKGYRPFEIPINYSSRSFADGKKVTFFRDPLTWLKADLKYRFANPFDPLMVSPNSRQSESPERKMYEIQ